MIETLQDLRSIYSTPKPRSLAKQLDHLDKHCRNFIGLAPFLVLATVGKDGRVDASPRGGAPGFVRAPARATAKAGSRTEAEASLLEADKALSATIGSNGAASAFRAVMHPQGRLHRNGALPMTSRDEAAAWLEANVKAMTSEPMKSETGASGDLGYTWGKMTLTGADGKPQSGYYVRVWTLGDGNRWQLVADITPA